MFSNPIGRSVENSGALRSDSTARAGGGIQAGSGAVIPPNEGSGSAEVQSRGFLPSTGIAKFECWSGSGPSVAPQGSSDPSASSGGAVTFARHSLHLGETTFTDDAGGTEQRMRPDKPLHAVNVADLLKQALADPMYKLASSEDDRVQRFKVRVVLGDGRKGVVATAFHHSSDSTTVTAPKKLTTPTRVEEPVATKFSDQVIELIDKVLARCVPWKREECGRDIAQYIHGQVDQSNKLDGLHTYVVNRQNIVGNEFLIEWLNETNEKHELQRLVNDTINDARDNPYFELPLQAVHKMLTRTDLVGLHFFNQKIQGNTWRSSVYNRIFASAEAVKSVNELHTILLDTKSAGKEIRPALMTWRKSVIGRKKEGLGDSMRRYADTRGGAAAAAEEPAAAANPLEDVPGSIAAVVEHVFERYKVDRKSDIERYLVGKPEKDHQVLLRGLERDLIDHQRSLGAVFVCEFLAVKPAGP